ANGFGAAPGPGTPPPAAPAEHPAYALRPQVPLPPPYLPNTPPPFNGPGGSGEFDPSRRARRRWIAAVSGVAVAAVAVTATLLYGPLSGDKHHDNSDPTTTPPVTTVSPTAAPANLKRHGGKAGTGYNGGLDGVVNASDRRGGTLKIAVANPEENLLDPAATYYTGSWNLQRLFLRKLVDYAPVPGPAGRKLVPDLATDTGRVSNGGRTWTFTLKSGLKYEDGTPITSKDIKYGIERTFDRLQFGAGPDYFVQLLDQGQNYPGPHKDSAPDSPGLRSVATPDDTTIVFTLAKPYADFGYVLAMPMAAPVPRSADTGDGSAYGKKPVSSGPYKIVDYTEGKSLHLVRNPHWDQSTDPIRSALPDAIDLTEYTSQDAVENALLANQADLDLYAQTLSAGNGAKVASGELKDQADLVYSGSTRYLSLQTNVAPFDNRECRAAVQYAVDRSAVRMAMGGQNGGGEVATTMLPPVVDGYDSGAHPYGGADGKPDTAKARAALAACGRPQGFDVTIVGSSGSPVYVAGMEAVQSSLKAVGIRVTVKQIPADTLYQTLGSPAKVKQNGWGMAIMGWGSDWPAGGGFLPLLVGSASSSNYTGVHDAALDGLMENAESAGDPAESTDRWKAADAQVMSDAALVPLVWGRHLVLRGSRLTNAYQQQAFGNVDLAALGVEA
ncbi:MAG: ABC transporter substrate-binding protein, partial [Streptomyces sp.]|nr:ABC transporter substrate-binding protein [Streptomyces sp.]